MSRTKVTFNSIDIGKRQLQFHDDTAHLEHLANHGWTLISGFLDHNQLDPIIPAIFNIDELSDQADQDDPYDRQYGHSQPIWSVRKACSNVFRIINNSRRIYPTFESFIKVKPNHRTSASVIMDDTNVYRGLVMFSNDQIFHCINGSHKRASSLDLMNATKMITPAVRKGDLLIWHSRLAHSYHNSTNHNIYAIPVAYLTEEPRNLQGYVTKWVTTDYTGNINYRSPDTDMHRGIMLRPPQVMTSYAEIIG